jgi:cellulose biosynthesis operon protein BcsF/YhjT
VNSYDLGIGDILSIAAVCALIFLPLGWRLHASRARLAAVARLLLPRRDFKDLGTLGDVMQNSAPEDER